MTMKKNNLFIFLMLSTATAFISSCEPQSDPLTHEQYKKEVYLVGAAQDIQDKEVAYNGDGSLYVSVAIGGTQFPSEDVQVTIGRASDDKMKLYNYKNFSADDVKYQTLPTDWYEFPSLTGTIKAGEAYCRIPLKLKTNMLHPDSLYVIPLKVVSTNAYSAVDKDTVLLVHPKMGNDYSGSYTFEGATWQMINGQKDTNSASVITTLRNATALDASTIRLFNKVVAEKIGNVASSTYNIRVNSDNTLTITPYDQLGITAGGGTYNPVKKSFKLWYTIEENGRTYRTEATLTRSNKS